MPGLCDSTHMFQHGTSEGTVFCQHPKHHFSLDFHQALEVQPDGSSVEWRWPVTDADQERWKKEQAA
jgi:hypothetical protein